VIKTWHHVTDLDVVLQEVVAQEYLKAPPATAMVGTYNVQTLHAATIQIDVQDLLAAQAVADKPVMLVAVQIKADVLLEVVRVLPLLLVEPNPVLVEKQTYFKALTALVLVETVVLGRLLKQ
jgi:hypothetical protein